MPLAAHRLGAIQEIAGHKNLFSSAKVVKFCTALDKLSHTPPSFARISFLAGVYKLKRHHLISSAGAVLVILHFWLVANSTDCTKWRNYV